MATGPSSSFLDAWVIDRTLFDHASLGSCECCGGGQALMARSPLLLELCTDLDTDDRRKDAEAKWPSCMKEQIDRDRLGIRRRLKATLPRYQALASTATATAAATATAEEDAEKEKEDEEKTKQQQGFAAWWAALPLARKQRIAAMPVAEVPVVYATELDVRSGAYSTLLSALLEQVRRFPETGYAPDGVTEAEVAFESALRVAKQGAFVLAPESLESPSFLSDLARFVGGATLLLPHPKRRSSGSGSTEATVASTETSCFRGDRRLIRVVIARHMLDRAIRQFEGSRREQQEGDARKE